MRYLLIVKILIRFFDIIFSLLAITILLPFILPIMIILKFTGEHYIFYRQSRVGRYGKDFNLFKFATMLKDSPNLPGGLFTYKNDARILPIGYFLRKTKINELPQLINILIGQMSLVGYRPLVKKGYDEYSNEIKDKLFNFRPGLSGIGSIIFRNEEEIMKEIDDKDTFYKEIIIPYKGLMEGWFIDNYSIINYFIIIFMTLFVILKPSSYLWRKVFKNFPSFPKELEKYLDKNNKNNEV